MLSLASLDPGPAIERGLQFIYKVASDPKVFTDWGHDLLWCFYTIAATSRDPKIREMAYRMGHERAIAWRREHPEPPADDVGDFSNFVFGADGADRLGVRDDAVRERARKIVAHYSLSDFLDFDPTREPPPADIPEPCPTCDYQNPRGATKCEKDNTPLKFKSRYDVWLDALIETYSGESYGVKLGASYDDVLRWISVMRPYPSPKKVGAEETGHIIYAITHVVYTLNDYGKYRLSPKWLPREFRYLKNNLQLAERNGDSETLGEFMDTLRAFGMNNKDKLVRDGVEYLLSHQNPDGSWGNVASQSAYTRYHTTWTAIDGLRDYSFQGERLRRPELRGMVAH